MVNFPIRFKPMEILMAIAMTLLLLAGELALFYHSLQAYEGYDQIDLCQQTATCLGAGTTTMVVSRSRAIYAATEPLPTYAVVILHAPGSQPDGLLAASLLQPLYTVLPLTPSKVQVNINRAGPADQKVTDDTSVRLCPC